MANEDLDSNGGRVLRPGREDEDRFDRSRRITWLNMDAIHNAHVLVVGAGATGNEVIKNLVLSGFRHITVVDMDHVVRANLNRCVFFRTEDADNKRAKAEVVAQRAGELDPGVDIRPHVARIDELDEGVWAHDIILSCVDNIQTRLYLNVMAHEWDIPLIDCGTHGLYGKVQVVIPNETPCIECVINRSHERVVEKRYSCTGKDVKVFEPHIPAEITTTAIVGAIVVREALKILSSRADMIVRNIIHYNGESHSCEELELSYSRSCSIHGKVR